MGGKDKALHREFRVEILELRVESLDLRVARPSIPSNSSTPRKILTSLNSKLSTLNSQLSNLKSQLSHLSSLTKRAFQQSLLELGWHCADLPPLLQLVPN